MKANEFSLMIFPFMPELATRKMTFEDVVKLASETGFSYIDTTKIGYNEIKSRLKSLDKYNVSIYCHIEIVSLFAKENELREELQAQLEKAKLLKAQKLMIIPYKPFFDVKKAKKIGPDKTMETMVNGFKIASEMSAKVGIPVCFETTPHDILRLSSNDDCDFILKQVPGLQFVFDTANMLPHGDNPLDAFKLLHERADYVHLKDVCLTEPKKSLMEQETLPDGKIMKCCVWGEGVIPVREIYEKFKQSGYAGRFAVEYAKPHDGICSYEEHKKQIEKFLSGLSADNSRS